MPPRTRGSVVPNGGLHSALLFSWVTLPVGFIRISNARASPPHCGPRLLQLGAAGGTRPGRLALGSR